MRATTSALAEKRNVALALVRRRNRYWRRLTREILRANLPERKGLPPPIVLHDRTARFVSLFDAALWVVMKGHDGPLGSEFEVANIDGELFGSSGLLANGTLYAEGVGRDGVEAQITAVWQVASCGGNLVGLAPWNSVDLNSGTLTLADEKRPKWINIRVRVAELNALFPGAGKPAPRRRGAKKGQGAKDDKAAIKRAFEVANDDTERLWGALGDVAIECGARDQKEVETFRKRLWRKIKKHSHEIG